jgi:hypothetical protein
VRTPIIESFRRTISGGRVYVALGLLVLVGLGTQPAQGFAASSPGVPSESHSGTTGARSSVSSSACDIGWGITPSPNVGPSASVLYDVDAISANDAWAVGKSGFSGPVTLVQHWNGTEWSVVASPNIGTEGDYLYGVDALSTNDVWAVGTGMNQPLVEHWNGTQWSIVPAPAPGGTLSILYGVSAIATDDVWTVGAYFNNGIYSSLIQHWNGTQWSIVLSPNIPNTYNVLKSVSVISPTDAWAVGHTGIYPSDGSQTLVMHWDGTTWSIVPAPGPGQDENALLKVAAVSSGDVWAVGNSSNGSTWQTLTMHWNGTAWSTVPSPSIGSGTNYLYGLRGLTALSSNDIWAVGSYFAPCRPVQTLIEQWDGTQWSVVASDNVDPRPNMLNGVAAAPSGEIWAVGQYEDAKVNWPQTLVEQYAAQPVVFTDICAQDYYYKPVNYMRQHNIISGYEDGTFRPVASTTRAQAAKMVVLAMGWGLVDPSTPTFSDVPTTSPFYRYIETANAHGIATGYSDQTFRPSAELTRGQIVKMIVVAEGWDVLVPAVPSFSDVPSDSPFFIYVETAHCRCMVGGYGDGTFRPGNNTTRGQVATMLYRALHSTGPCD